MKIILSIIAGLIVYGSLYPFHFSLEQFTDANQHALFNFDISNTKLSDLVANVVLFVPFGLILRASFVTRSAWSSLPFLLIYTFIFAFAIQAMQLWTLGRLPWGGDAVWNVVGCWIGLGLYRVSKLDALNQLRAMSVVKQISFALALLLILLKLAPFAPSIDFQLLKDNVKALLTNPQIDWYWTFEKALFWLVSFFFIRLSYPRWDKLYKLSLLVGCVIGLKFIIISSNVNLSEILAGLLALGVWLIASTRISAKVLALLMLLAILGNGLYPFELRTTPGSFNWLPFTGSMGGNILINIIAMSKKLVFYGSSVWLIYLVTNKLTLGAVVCILVVLLSEFLQTLFTNSVPESTDAFLVLFVVFIFSTILKSHPTSNQKADSSLGAVVRQNSSRLSAQARVQSNSTIVKGDAPAVTTKQYIPALDGLRAVAALAVFVVHFQQFSGIGWQFGVFDFERWMINGNTGVALFFVLSGFLLSVPFWSSIRRNTFPNIKHYFVNRAVRIIPIYYLCLFGLLAIKIIKTGDLNVNDAISHIFFVHNFKDYQVMSLNPPFWTLAVEFQFYLLLPLIFLLFAKVTKAIGINTAQWLCLLMIPAIYFGYRLMMQGLEVREDWPIIFPLIWPFGVSIASVKGPALIYSLFAHLPHFLIGVFAASLYRYEYINNRSTKGFAEFAFWSAGILIFVILATDLDIVLQLSYGRYNFPFVPILLGVVVFTAPLTQIAKSALEFAPIKWMGVISYGIYIFHYPIQKATLTGFSAIGLDAKQHIVLYVVVSFAITLLLSHLSYKLIETPILQRFRRKNTARMDKEQHQKDAYASSAIGNETKTSHAGVRPASTISHSTKTESSSANMGMQNNKTVWYAGAIVIAVIVFFGFYKAIGNSSSVTIKQAYWSGPNQRELVFDHHAHTQYSDGGKSIVELSDMAFINGCDAFSITDHSQNSLSFSATKLDEIAQMRSKYPGMLIVAGIELGMPSYNGREHINILATPDVEEKLLGAILNNLRTSSNMQKKLRDLHVLEPLQEVSGATENSFVVYNHPSRKVIHEKGDENLSDVKYWNKDFPYITALSGAPGHQKAEAIGSYRTNLSTIDRWDPVVAEVGGAWDKLLAQGFPIWGAIASSDYHNDGMDYAPCEFSRIHVAAPSKDYKGLIKGLRAGTFWADHGQLLTQYEFSVSVDNEQNSTYPGGTLILSNNQDMLAINLKVKRNKPFVDDFLRIDLITNCGADNVVTKSQYMPPEQSQLTFFMPILQHQEACFLRSRVVHETAEDNDLSAYSNPIFIRQ